MADAKIPVINLNSTTAADDLLHAACLYGFIFIEHSDDIGLAPIDVDTMFDVSRDFFASPTEEKAECHINSKESGSNRGWLSMHTETLDPKNQKKGDFKEGFNFGEFKNGKAQQPIPKSMRPHEHEISKFFDDCHALCNRVMELLAVALKIDDSQGGKRWFAERHDRSKGPSSNVLRFLYYPALPDSADHNPGEDIRAGAHSDYGSVTLLFRLPGQPGLEILTPSREWAPVPVNPAGSSSKNTLPILVNIGDALAYWTNDLLKSTVHRVIFPKSGEGRKGGADRYSIAYFCQPEDAAELVEIPSEVIRTRAPRSNGHANGNGKILTSREHLNSRLAATYGI